jgi:pimeloyl-ACP methyl ester carboxylesterase
VPTPAEAGIGDDRALLPYVKRDGIKLFYERRGTGEPPLLFVHGWCCDHSFFRPQVDHFASAHAVVTLDLRGCGQSDRPESGYDIPTLADDVAWLVGELGLSRPVVVGHSLGAMIAIELAAAHPSIPLAVVADDPGPIDPLPETRAVFEAFERELVGPGGEAARREWVEATPGATIDPGRREWIVETMCAVPLEVAAAVIRGLNEWDGAAALARCRVPTLVLRPTTVGSNSPERLLALKPDLHVGVTVGAGHFHQLEVPEQVTPMIERFLDLARLAP